MLNFTGRNASHEKEFFHRFHLLKATGRVKSIKTSINTISCELPTCIGRAESSKIFTEVGTDTSECHAGRLKVGKVFRVQSLNETLSKRSRNRFACKCVHERAHSTMLSTMQQKGTGLEFAQLLVRAKVILAAVGEACWPRSGADDLCRSRGESGKCECVKNAFA